MVHDVDLTDSVDYSVQCVKVPDEDDKNLNLQKQYEGYENYAERKIKYIIEYV